MPRIQDLSALGAITTASKFAGANTGTGSFTGQQVRDYVFASATAAASRTALGSTTVGDALFTAASAAAARSTLSSTTVGDALFVAASAAAARAALGATTIGDALVIAADAATGRFTIGAPALPNAAGGIGEWKISPFVDGANAVLPAGGTWAYLLLRLISATGAVEAANCVAGASAGGTTVATGTSGYLYTGLVWRIS